MITHTLLKWIVGFLVLTCLVHAEVLDTWIIAGQSNAEGYGITESPVPGLAPASTLSSIGRSVLNVTHPNIQMFQGANEYNGINASAGLSLPAKDVWHSMNAQEGFAYDWGSGRGNESGRRFGPELSFGYDVQAKMGTRIALIKYARGSASIAPSTTQGGGIWLDFDPNDGGRLNHYDKLITTIQTAVNNLPAGQVLNVRGVIWMQGEGDATATFAPAYQANLTEFITTLRNDIGTMATASGGKMTGAAASWGQLDVFLGTIQNSSTNHQTVINAQNAVAAADANVHTVNATTGLSLMTVDDWGYGGLHYDTAGQVLLGERFADAALKEVIAADSFGNGTVKIPTTASGGTGTVANLQTDNDVNYTVAKSATATIGGFGTYGSAISSVYLFVQYSVETGYTGTNAIKVNGVNTPIVPAARDYGRWAYVDITGGSFGIDTSAEISNLSVTFLNNHGGGTAKSVLLDSVYVVVNPQTAIPTPPTWVEDFNGTGQANPMVWGYEVGYQRNNEDQYYVAGTSNGWQEGGNFIIEGRKESTYPGYNYTSASIITTSKYYWKFGRAQIRAKIPAKPGMWPAIWGTGEVGNWPHNGEVDIMEYYGEKILANVAVGTATAWNAKWDSASRTLPSLLAVDSNWRDAWHIWTMQWDDVNVRLYVDNILMNTIPQTWMVNTAGYNTSWGPQYPFQSNGMNCWLNLAMGGNAGGDPTATMNSGPQRYLIDYWKVWEGATNNVAPTDIAVSGSGVTEGLAAGTVVGTLSATDADPAEVLRYTLVAGTGSTHNAQFAIPEFISGNTLQGVLKTTAILNYADGATRSIRVRVTDIEGAFFEKIIIINVIPGVPVYPEVGVTRGASPIADGVTDSITASSAGVATGLTYSIANSGDSNLTIGTAAASGQSNCTVVINTQPSTPVVPTGSTNFVLSVTPTSAGAWSFNVSIPNSDPNENPYNWTISGNAQPPVQITTASPMTAGTVSTAYSQTLTATGGVTPYTWSFDYGSYTESAPTLEWWGLGSTPVTLTSGTSSEGYHTYTLPWSFRHYGVNYTSVHMHTNGFLDFTSTALDNANLDSDLMARKMIAPLFDDLDMTVGMYVAVAPDNSFVAFRWDGIIAGQAARVIKMEALLYRDGRIRCNYLGSSTGSCGATVGVSAGNNADYTLSTLNNATWMPAGVSRLFTPATSIPPGLSLAAATGVLSGTPTVAGVYSLKPVVTDSLSSSDTKVLSLTIQDDVNGALKLSSPSYFVNESTATLNITVHRTAGTTGAVGVSYATANGTATAGSDYTAASGTLSWADGDNTAKTISIPITLDASAESDETLTVTLSAPSGGAILGGPSSGVVTIYDSGTVTMSASDTTGSEPGRTDGNGSFTITRTGSLYEALTVPYAMTGTATNGSDYALLSGTAVIPVGSTSVVVPVTITDDTVLEANETAIMSLQTGTGYTLGATVTGTVTLRDDEPCTVSVAVTDSDCQETASNDGVYTITRLGNTSAAITVNYGMSGTSANGTDYAALVGTAAIAANANTVTVAINTTDDSSYEPTETAIITLATGTGYAIGTPDNATISIIDNDKPTIAVTATDGIATEAGPTTATYTFTRSNDVVRDAITVYYAVTGTATAYSDYQALSGSVVIPAGQDTATVTATPIDDTLNESAETVIVTISANGAYTVGGAAATATISDNEIQVVTVSATDNTASEPGRTDGNGVFTFTRIGDTSADLAVNYVMGGTAVNGSDYTSLSGTVTIPAGQSSATEAVVPTDDTEFEINETVILNLASGTGYAIGYYAANPTVTIRDDDVCIVTVATTDADARELAAANAGTYTITRTGSLASAITVNYTMSGTAVNGTDYATLTGSLTIAANAQTGTVTLTPTDDALSEGDETATMTLSAGTGYTVGTPASSTITIGDGELPIISFGTSDLDASEPSANNGYFRISRAGATTAVTVNYTISGTATSGSDFTAVTGSVTFPASNNSQDAVISVLDDALAEDPETVILAISPNAAYSIAGPTSQTMTLRDDENTVTLAATDASATEGGGTGTFRFTKSIAAGALAVNYTLTGTASNGTDYTYQTGSITIPNGQTFTDLVITANDDFIYDPNETVIITLAANGTAYSMGTIAGQTLTITESDSRPAVHVIASDSTASETPSSTGFFTLYLSKQFPANTAVAYSVSGTATNGTDCTALSGSVTFNAGVLEQRITVTPTVDGVTESPETLTVSVTPGVSYVAGTPSSSTVVISDDGNPTAAPEMQVLGAELVDQPINSGDNTPSITDGTDFATVDASGYEERTFTIVNSGAAALNLTGAPKVAISGDAAFSVVSQPVTPVAGNGGMTTFAIRCTPGTIGIKTATVSIASNDSDENPYTFAMRAVGKNVVWFAYHDMNNQADTGSDHPNITKGSTHGTGYALKDISSGVSLAPQIQFKYHTNAGAENAALLKQNTTATTPDKTPLYGDAYADFSGVIDMAQRSFYLTTSPAPSSDYALINFTGLNPAQKYSISLFHNRGATGADVTRYTLQNATSYIAAGSEGIGGGSDSDVADEDVHYGQYNTIAGDLARWDAIVPTGTSLTIRVECQAGANFYLPTGIMLEESSDAATSGVVQLSSTAYSVNENGTSVTMTATRTGSSTGAASVNYATSNDTATAGSDYTAASGTLNWADGDMSNKTFTVSIADDTLVEGNETFDITLSGASGATMGAQSTATATITDNDTGTISIAATTQASEPATNGLFTLTTTNQFASSRIVNLTISGTATNGTDYSSIASTVTFPANQSTVTIPVTVTDDLLAEGSETVIVTLGAGTGYSVAGSPNHAATATISDNDIPGFTISAISGNTTEAGGSATFTVKLSSQPTANVVLGLSSSDTTEGTVTPASLTFTNANWNTNQTVTVTGADDAIIDGTIAYNIVTAAATSTDFNYSGVNPTDVALSNTDNDVAGYTVSKTTSTVAENGGTDTFTVVLTAQPASNVVFSVTSSAAGEATALPATLTFTTANWNTAQPVTITGVDDLVVGTHSATVTVSVVDGSSDNNWDLLADKTVSVTCTDNDDTAGFTLSKTTSTVAENGGTDTFTVVLATQPASDVVFSVTSSATGEATVSPATLTFTTTNWNTAQLVTVTGVNDNTLTSDTATVTVSVVDASSDNTWDPLADKTVSVTCTNDDAAGFSLSKTVSTVAENGGTDTFTVVLAAQPASDVVLNVTSSATGEATASPAPLTFTAANWNTAQTVTVTGVNDNTVTSDTATVTVSVVDGSSDNNWDPLADKTVSVACTNDDTAGFTIGAISGNTTEAGGTATFTVRLASQPTADVVLGLSSNDTTEGSVNPVSLTFTAVNWNSNQSVTVTGVDDATIDGDTAYGIVTAAATSTDTDYSGSNPADVSVTNSDNDCQLTVSNDGNGTTVPSGAAVQTIGVPVAISASPNVNYTFVNWTVVSGSASFGNSSMASTTVTLSSDAVIRANFAAGGTLPVYEPFADPDPSLGGNTPGTGLTGTWSGGASATVLAGSLSYGTLPTSGGKASVASGSNASVNIGTSLSVPGLLTNGATLWFSYVVSTNSASSTNDIAGFALGTDALSTSNSIPMNNSGSGVGVSYGRGTRLNAAYWSGGTLAATNNNSGLTLNTPTLIVGKIVWGANDTASETITLYKPGTDLALPGTAYAVHTAPALAQSTFDTITFTRKGDTGETDLYDEIRFGSSYQSVIGQSSSNAGFTVSKTSSTVAENGGTDTFTVVVSAQPTSDVVLSVGSSATGEATVSPSTLTFTNANWNIAQTVTVTGVNDSSLTTDSATITIGVVDASSDNNWDPLADKTVAVSCTNDDTASFVVGAISGSTTEAGGTATCTARLGARPSADVTFGLSSSDTTEGAVSPASLTFTTANWNVDQTVTVSGVDDVMTDGDIAYDIVTAVAVTADADYSGLDPADVAVTNTDDDTAGFALSKVASTVVENGDTDTFTAVLTAQPANSVVFNVTSSATGEATVSPATLTFTAANWNTAQTVTITGVNDNTVTNDSAIVTLSVVGASSDDNWDLLADKTVDVTCTNDDTAGFAVGAISGNTTEAGGTATFTVKLNTVPTANVSIALSSSDLTEGTASPASLTFTPADWSTNQTVTVTGVDDATADGNIAYSIVTAAAVSADGNYSGVDPADVAATNTDNDYVLTVSNDGNGTTVPSGASDRIMDTAVGISATASTGYHFVNWTVESGTPIPTIADADQSSTTVTASAAATIQANFAPDTYTVTYNANGGTTPNPTTQIVTFDSTYATLATTTRSGYTFDGWFTAASGGTRVDPGTTVTTAGDHALYAQWTVIPPEVILFADDFNAANGISLTDPASRATGTLASIVKYAFNSTTGVIVNGMLSWDDNNSRDTNHQQTDAAGPQNLSITHNWAPQVTGKIWEVEFKQRVGWNHPLTFGLSDNAQTGQWNAWDSADYDFAVGSFGTSLRYDFDDQSGTNLADLASIFPSPPNTTDTHHIRIRFDEPAGITTVWINGVIRLQTTGLDFENTERYLTWGEPNNYGGAIDDLIVRQINYATVASFAIAGVPAQVPVGSPVSGITITAKDDANQTATSFTGTVTFGGTAGITGTSANFVAGVLTGVSVTPTSVGAGRTFTVDDGASHTGSASFDVQTVFANWSGGASVTADANNDGVANGLAWLFGAANPSVNAITLQPTFDNTTDADYFIYTYRRSDSAFYAAGTTNAVEYGSMLTLGSWTTAVHDGTNIIITPTNDFYGAGVDKVELKIKKTLASGGKLFARVSLQTN